MILVNVSKETPSFLAFSVKTSQGILLPSDINFSRAGGMLGSISTGRVLSSR